MTKSTYLMLPYYAQINYKGLPVLRIYELGSPKAEAFHWKHKGNTIQ